ncbi:MAG TPA: universal stress protein [Sandaracinaceae bacterium LLY-WYZ-13_1]|nr:universal stress protein [Sandaracinaceae bacterium LLY-WYZ-13_1]
MERVLACVDHAEGTDGVVARAAELAERLGGPLHVLHVAPAEPEWVGYDPGPKSVRDDVAKDLREAHRKTQALAEPLRSRGLEVTPLTVQGPAVDAILAQAAKLAADVIVIGAHRRGRLHELFAGSVTRQVIRKGDVPVLVVPAR